MSLLNYVLGWKQYGVFNVMIYNRRHMQDVFLLKIVTFCGIPLVKIGNLCRMIGFSQYDVVTDVNINHFELI